MCEALSGLTERGRGLLWFLHPVCPGGLSAGRGERSGTHRRTHTHMHTRVVGGGRDMLITFQVIIGDLLLIHTKT